MLKELTKEELLALFDAEVHAQLEARMQVPNTDAIVVFENMQMDSSAFGSRSAYPVGSPWTFKDVADLEGKWINDLPSQRQYATSFYRIPKGTCGGAVR